jgi:hypothetical protein
MKIKEAIGLLATVEHAPFRADLVALRFGNAPVLVDWWDACIALCKAGDDWKESDLWQRLQGTSPTKENINYLRTRTTALARCIEQFLGHVAFAADLGLQELCLLRELARRNWGAGYAATYRKMVERMDKQPLRGMEQYAAFYHSQEEHLLSGFHAIDLDYQKPIYQGTLDALDRAYVLKKLSLACKSVTQDRRFGTMHALPMIDAVLAWVDQLESAEEPLLYLYRLLYALVSEESVSEDASRYHRVRDFLQLHWKALKEASLVELQDVCTYLINHCVKQMNAGAETYKGKVVELYDWLLSAQVLEVQGKIDPGNYRNAFLALSGTGDNDAVERLLNDYGSHVGGDTAPTLVQFCRGMHAMNQAKWEEAASKLDKALVLLKRHADDRLEAEIRSLLARAAFASGDLHATKDRLQGLKRLLGNTKLPVKDKEPFSLFHKHLLQLMSDMQLPAELQPQAHTAHLQQFLDLKERVFAKKWLTSILETHAKK